MILLRGRGEARSITGLPYVEKSGMVIRGKGMDSRRAFSLSMGI